ncbi:MAG: hypothetical protein D4R45_03280 [Planctomycetaceae bacterium]|nr:MAG: hypothetical protein D4R45_03280 [Planctomycetaceae bacterium]
MAWIFKKNNPIKFAKRHEVVRVLLLGKSGRTFKFGQMIKEGDFIRDASRDLTYGPVRLAPLFDSAGRPCYTLHEESGAPLEAETHTVTREIDPHDGWTATQVYDGNGNAHYVFEEETGRPMKIEFSEVVAEMKTDPELMSILTSRTIIGNILNLQYPSTMLILVGLVCLFLGYIIGGY